AAGRPAQGRRRLPERIRAPRARRRSRRAAEPPRRGAGRAAAAIRRRVPRRQRERLRRPPLRQVVKALVRRPSPRLAEGIVTHLERQPVDVDLARSQWSAYVQALEDAGWEPVEAPPADQSPDGVFVEDAVVVHEHVAVVTRPGVEARRSETVSVEAALAELGYAIERIGAPGALEGGEGLRARDGVHVGLSGRTTAGGPRQLRELLPPRGGSVVEVPLAGVLHLKSAVTALPDGSILGHPPLVPEAL